MTPVDFSDPASVVAAFIRTMHAWESLAGHLRIAARKRFNPDNPSSMHPEEVRVSDTIFLFPPLIVATFLTVRPRA